MATKNKTPAKWNQMCITTLDVCTKELDKPLQHGPLFQVQNDEITNVVKRILELKTMETYFVHSVIDLVVYERYLWE